MKSDTRSFYESVVRRAVERIAGQLGEAVELGALARMAALSPLHFHHVFRGMVGETPLELHRRLRLERAAWQLLNGDASVITIAFDAGYETHEAFTRAFRAAYGSPPSAFRDRSADADGRVRPFQFELAARCGVHFRGPIERVVFMSGGDEMNVEIETLAEMRGFAVQHRGPYNQISRAFQRLGEIAGSAGLVGKPGTHMIALYHDDPETTPPEALRSDAALVVQSAIAVPEGTSELRIPGGPYARARHVGSYSRLGDSWARLMGDWLPKSGRRVADGPSFEIYRNTPMDTKEADLVTDLYLPLA